MFSTHSDSPASEHGLGTPTQWVVNAADPSALARFWSGVLGGRAVDRGDGWAYVDDVPGWGRLSFQPDPAPKSTMNRIHLDVSATDLPTATDKARALGADRVGEVVTDAQGSFQVMRDPEGNEFCLVTPAAKN